MEARSFFENSPMAEIVVSATEEDWTEIIDFLFEYCADYMTADTAAWRLVQEVGKLA